VFLIDTGCSAATTQGQAVQLWKSAAMQIIAVYLDQQVALLDSAWVFASNGGLVKSCGGWTTGSVRYSVLPPIVYVPDDAHRNKNTKVYEGKVPRMKR